jgi:tryptophanyl-tRNA synthetase
MERDGAPTTQTTSALILHGESIPVASDESPYITMSRRLVENYSIFNLQSSIETDWSAAAFWYEYIAIHGGELLLEGLQPDSLQGDRVVADIYAQHFGVQTTFTANGAIISNRQSIVNCQSSNRQLSIDFSHCPDLYPAIALTCEKLSIELIATGTERLRFKESDRLEAVRLHEVRNDHRIAMALMAADYIDIQSLLLEKRSELQNVIAKSYPDFINQFINVQPSSHGKKTAKSQQRDGNDNQGQTNVSTLSVSHITPIRGVNDDNLGKKHALSKLIHAASSEYVWLHDDDIVLPPASNSPQGGLTTQWSHSVNGLTGKADLIILPLRMESNSLPAGRAGVGLLERLQIAEYAAIQELTMRTAKRGRAVMCSGANLIVRREVWLACEPDLHPEIPSGDDMFLLEAAKRRGYTVGVIDEPEYTAIVRPQTSWRAFFRQRMRWAGKAPHYTDPDIRRCGLIVSLANIAQLLCPPIILIKFPIEYSLIRKRESSYTLHPTPYTKKPRTPWYVALLLELLYPIYMLVAFFGGLVRTRKW